MSKKAKSKRSKQPAERREPSERDQEIYSQVKAGCKLQKELAVEYEMDKSRVSQIVKNVELWFADASPRDGELDHGQRLRLERRLERERLELLYGASVRMMREFEKPAEATRKQGEEVVKTTREERNSRLQALKCAIRTTESLGKLAEREPAPLPPEATTHLRADVLYGHLTHEREEAEAKGRVAASSGCAWDVVYYVLGALHGDLLDPVDPTSVLAAALTQIVGRLVGLGAGAGERGQGTEDRGEGTEDRGQKTGAREVRGEVSSAPSTEYSVLSTRYLADAGGGSGAQLAQPDGAVERREMSPDAGDSIAASDWQQAGYGDSVPVESTPDSNRFAGEKMSELSAETQDGTACPPRASSGMA